MRPSLAPALKDPGRTSQRPSRENESRAPLVLVLQVEPVGAPFSALPAAPFEEARTNTTTSRTPTKVAAGTYIRSTCPLAMPDRVEEPPRRSLPGSPSRTRADGVQGDSP